MPTKCDKCGVTIADPSASTHCPGCGYEFTVISPGTPPTTISPLTSAPQVLGYPPEQSDPGDSKIDAVVGGLLDRIAAQSHFEERYKLLGEIASGGMGIIHRGYDLILKREVAIKMMRAAPGSATEALWGQFLKEARVGGRLLHPNVLPVFDLGVNQKGQIYYTMRLVDGSSLQDCLDALDRAVVTRLISFPLRKIVEAFVAACHGVDHAHHNGVLHLDLKPRNILVSGFHEIFVIDWGLARVDDKDDTGQLAGLYKEVGPAEHETGTVAPAAGPVHVVGTPAYMAPEQARGAVKEFGPHTDVYGLGGVFHFILYNQPPNRGLTVAQIAALDKQPHQRPKPPLRTGIVPRGRRVKKQQQDAIAALEEICRRALAPTFAERYPDVEVLLVELNEWLASTPLAVLLG